MVRRMGIIDIIKVDYSNEESDKKQRIACPFLLFLQIKNKGKDKKNNQTQIKRKKRQGEVSSYDYSQDKEESNPIDGLIYFCS